MLSATFAPQFAALEMQAIRFTPKTDPSPRRLNGLRLDSLQELKLVDLQFCQFPT
jgi:hypothetical protein